MAETPAPAPQPARSARPTLNSFGRFGIDMLAALRLQPWHAALILIVVFGGLLRFHGLDWDKPEGAATPLQMHPDERFISFVSDGTRWPDSVGEYFDTANSPLNPYNAPNINSYVYGTFPLFLGKGVSDTYEHSPGWVKDTLSAFGLEQPGGITRYDRDVVWGRRVTALIDTLTILLVYGVGSVLFSRRVGLLGAFLYACAVLPAQLAHFWTMDPYVAFFAAAAMLCSAHMVRAQTMRSQAVLSGLVMLCVGFGLASKVTAWPIALLPVLAFALRVAIRDFPVLGLNFRGVRPNVAGNWANDLSFLLITVAGSAIVFRIAQPYAFEGPAFWNMGLNPEWKANLLQEIEFQNGNADYPPFIQWANRTPFLWPLENMVLWGLGPALGIAGWVAMGFAAFTVFKRREMAFVLPLALAAAIFGFQGPRMVAWMRYFVPMYPVLCLFAAWGMVWLWDAARTGRGVLGRERMAASWRGRSLAVRTTYVRVAAIAVVLLVLQFTVWWALAFQNVYSNENPRLVASRWIYENIPAGSTLTSEIWDDSLPYALPEYDAGQYRRVETEPFHPDTPEKFQELIFGYERNGIVNRGLNGADYVIISSHRVKGAVKQLPLEYPATNRYYELLDSGELGFELVAHFEQRPSFLGVSIDDSRADESFTVYDHPEVSIYRKTADWDPIRALELLNQAHPERAENILPRQGATNGLQFTQEEFETQRNGGTFTDVFDADGWASHLPWVWWFLWLEILAVATVPWMTWLFRSLPDRGYGLSKFAGFAVPGLVTWLAVAWGVFHFSSALTWAVFFLTVGVGAGVGYLRWDALVAELRERWRTVVAVEGVFVAAFAFFLLLRAFNPDMWHHPLGGEKPMELGYLTAVTRSTILPPVDPWFGGGSMNYYYMGWFMLAVPIRAFRLVPEVAFNLAIPTYAAVGATLAFSTVHNLVGLSIMRRAGGAAREVSWRPIILAGLLGTVLLIGIGNLDGLHQTIERFQQLNVAGVDAAGEPVYRWSFASDVPFLGGLVGFLSGLKQWLFDGAALRDFDWWRSSRVHIGQFDITEFPYWSLLFADLHPHLMGVPFFGFVVAAGTGYIASCVAGLRRQTWVLAAALGLAIGTVRMVHTWDFPTVVLLGVAAIAVGQLLRPGRWDLRFWQGMAHLAIVGAILFVVFAPFNAHFEVFSVEQPSPDSTMATLMPGPLESVIHRLGLIPAPETTRANQYFVHFGLFLFATCVFLAVRYWEILREGDYRESRNPVLYILAGRWEVIAFLLFVVGVTTFSWQFRLTVVVDSLILLVLLFNLIWIEFRSEERDIGRLVATALLAGAIGVAAGVDVVTLKNDIVRMNTVFKFSLQAWHLYALGSAYAAWYAGRVLWHWEGWNARVAGLRWVSRSVTAAGLVLFLGSMIFLWSGTRERQSLRFVETGPTLNGFMYFNGGGVIDDHGTPDPADDGELKFADDKPLIDYLRNEVQGMPVIVEAVGPLYHWTGRMSWNTGLPAVIGWDWHQTQQRWDYQQMIQRRRLETELFYKTPETEFAADYLEKYRVEYVVVGTAEYLYGTPEGIEKFASMPELQEVFRHDRYVIYRVSPEFAAAIR